MPASNFPAAFDVIMKGGMLIDGTGAPGFIGDVGIAGERIAAIGDLSQSSAREIFDCAGLAVTPGFIDIHTHSDLTVLHQRDLLSSLSQGVTSEVVGNCGFSLGLATPDAVFSLERRGLERAGIGIDWATLPEFFSRIAEGGGTAIHLSTLAGHGTIRKRVMGLAPRLPDRAELLSMQRELSRALEQGAIGLSSGLEYVPGMYADRAELTALARVAAEAGGFYATHLRDEGDFLEESVDDAIAIAEGAGISLQLSHHKAEKRANWGKVSRTLASVEAARARGVEIYLDQYPYTAYQTGLATIALPPWAVGGTPQGMAESLRDQGVRRRARAEMGIGLRWADVVIASCPPHAEYPGRTVEALAREADLDPRDWVLDLLSEGEAWISAAHFAMSEDDVLRVLSDPSVCIGSDGVGQAPAPGADLTHPRTYGTFARILERYVREEKVLTLEEAVRRMTGLPAGRLGWSERGRLAPGAVADLAVFDPAAIAETATFAAPHALAVGVRRVYVGGALAFSKGRASGSRTGRILKKP